MAQRQREKPKSKLEQGQGQNLVAEIKKQKPKKPWYKRIRLSFIIAAFLAYVILAPVFYSIIPIGSANTEFSIYSDAYDGLSVLRKEIEGTTNRLGGMTFQVVTKNTISGMNALNRFNGSGVYMIIGPSSSIDTTETLSLIFYLLRGGSVIIADDFGSGNEVLKLVFDLLSFIIDGFDNLNSTNLSFMGQSISGMSFEDFVSKVMGGSLSNTSSSVAGGTAGSSLLPTPSVSEFTGNTLLDLIPKLRRIAFNRSVLLESNPANYYQSPVQPIVTDIDHTDIPGISFTDGVNKVQLEYPTVLSLLVDINKTSKWYPLQKLTLNALNDQFKDLGVDFSFNISLPFFPLYSSKTAWVETDLRAAAKGTATPDIDEWGNVQFSFIMNLPILPNGGKIVFVADPSIFINKWTAKTTENDNLRLAKNLITMAVGHQIDTGKPIPVIFDSGVVYQPFNSPNLYVKVLLQLISSLSMFPLSAPFVPFIFAGFGRVLIPKEKKRTQLRRTKIRVREGSSYFSKKLEYIKETKRYGEAISLLYRQLKRLLATDVRFEDIPTPKNITSFFIEEYPQTFNRGELQRALKTIAKINLNPGMPISSIQAKNLLRLLKRMVDTIKSD